MDKSRNWQNLLVFLWQLDVNQKLCHDLINMIEYMADLEYDERRRAEDWRARQQQQAFEDAEYG